MFVAAPGKMRRTVHRIGGCACEPSGVESRRIMIASPRLGLVRSYIESKNVKSLTQRTRRQKKHSSTTVIVLSEEFFFFRSLCMAAMAARCAASAAALRRLQKMEKKKKRKEKRKHTYCTTVSTVLYHGTVKLKNKKKGLKYHALIMSTIRYCIC